MTITIDTTDTRSLKALAILDGAHGWLRCRAQDGAKLYGVPSQREPNRYYLANQQRCDCPDYQRREMACKHVLAVRLHCARAKGATR